MSSGFFDESLFLRENSKLLPRMKIINGSGKITQLLMKRRMIKQTGKCDDDDYDKN